MKYFYDKKIHNTYSILKNQTSLILIKDDHISKYTHY